MYFETFYNFQCFQTIPKQLLTRQKKKKREYTKTLTAVFLANWPWVAFFFLEFLVLSTCCKVKWHFFEKVIFVGKFSFNVSHSIMS